MKPFLEKYKNVIVGLLAVIIIVVFAGAVRYLAVEDNGKLISEIQKGQIIDSLARKDAEENEKIANAKRDSAIALLGASRQNESLIINKVFSLEKSVNAFQNQYFQQINELKNIQNEKDIVTDASTSEQLDFLSKYRYSEYK